MKTEASLQDASLLNVDFEYFDPSPTIDFHGLKTLLRQLLDADHQLIDLSELANIILAQPLLGSTVKCEGQESDPYAFLTVLNMTEHRFKPVMQAIKAYLSSKARSSSTEAIAKVLDATDGQVGLVLTERVINMPHQTIPPMYTMLLEEINWAREAQEPYNFTHYLILSRAYTEVISQLEDAVPPSAKKSKPSSSAAVTPEVFYFHPEDEILKDRASASCAFEYTHQGDEGSSDSKRAFHETGVKAQGLMMLIDASRFDSTVKAVSEYLGGGEDRKS